jgi:hypothetical protein
MDDLELKWNIHLILLIFRPYTQSLEGKYRSFFLEEKKRNITKEIGKIKDMKGSSRIINMFFQNKLAL